MYLRPEDLYKQFVVEVKTSDLNGKGRPIADYAPEEPPTIIDGVLAQADQDEQDRWKQKQHPITHTIVQRGAPKAKSEDRLTLGSRRFYIKGVENPGDLNLFTLYMVEERNDA